MAKALKMKCKDHPDKEAEYRITNPNNPITNGYYCEKCALDFNGSYDEPISIDWLGEEE